MPTLTTTPFLFLEEISAELTWTFQDTDDVAISNSALQTATITLYDIETDTIINSRNDQDILGVGKTGDNDVSITSGVATWYIQPGDNAIITSGIVGSIERHMVLIEWTWDPADGFGVRQGRHEIEIHITNMNRVP